MFLKYKIGLTIFSLYEIIAVLLLHCPRTCDAMFGTAFCDDHVFKYFIVCIAVPLLVFLIVMWIMEIIHGVRRRRSLLYKAKHAVKNMAFNIKNKISESVSARDVEKIISGAVLVGLKKYSDRNPSARRLLDEIGGSMDLDEYTDIAYPGHDVIDEKPMQRATRAKQTKKKK